MPYPVFRPRRLRESALLRKMVRETRLEELKERFNTVSQARFYVQQMGGNRWDTSSLIKRLK